MKNIISIAAIAALAGSASAASTVSFSPNVENFGASAQSVFDIDFALGNVASIDSVAIELAHSWASDLDLLLTAPDGSVFALTEDNGSGVLLGDGGSLLGGVGTYTFVEAAGFGNFAAFAFGDSAPAGTYDANSWASGPFAPGTWNISLADDANGDDGAVGSVTINYTLVPAPGAAGLLGLAGLAAARRRR